MVDKTKQKQMKQNTKVKPFGVRNQALIDARNMLIRFLFKDWKLSKSDISFVFNLSLQLINSILTKTTNDKTYRTRSIGSNVQRPIK
jgi:hypothetical protein